MIYKEIETTTDEVLEFIKNAGIDIETTSNVNAFRIRMPNDSIVEMPPDFNVFGDMSLFTVTGSYSYNYSFIEGTDNNYTSGNLSERYDNRIDPCRYIPAA